MFQTARLTLTAWYLLIIMIISIIFSGVIYNIVSHQIEGIIQRQNDRIKHFQQNLENNTFQLPPQGNPPPTISTSELLAQEKQLIITLIIVNSGILLLAGGAGYFLAGRTLRPIKIMHDEQNLFITSSSHELRTPIAVMKTETETNLLEKHISDKKAREMLMSNLDELNSLQILTNKLLHIAQNQINTKLEYNDGILLDSVIDTAIKKVQPLAKKKSITIAKSMREVMVLGDKDALGETFIILFENAIKYSPENTTITIKMQPLSKIIKVSISDQGIGIAQEDLPKIFDRFYRASRSRNEEGFGLGLAIAKKTIDLHKGTISATSILNKGTTFILTLPIQSH